ncbi:MAG: hypothetical protein K6E62_03640 [Lachnospiraceae bacterium]|nr:hypothetical protein [Lachnospiraceae bacterium]
MFINEYGNRNDPTVILLAPMMISGSDLYGQMSQYFQGSYKNSAGFAEWLVSRMFRKRKKLSAKLKGKSCSMLVKMYGDEFARLMAKNFERVTPQGIDTICHACCHYDLRKLTDEEQEKLYLDFGEKDLELKLSGKAIPVYIPKAELTIRPGYQHCGYMAAHPKEYVEEIEQFIGRSV